MYLKTMLAALAAFLIPVSAMAGEEALYAPVPPADSAFVRTVNLTGDATASIQLDGSSLPAGAQPLVSDYAVIKQGDHSLSAGAQKSPVTIEAKQYYTIVVAADGKTNVLKDALIEDPSKAMLYFYNLSDKSSVSLFAPSHKATVFENIAVGASTSRAINAVAIGLVVKAGDSEIGTTGDVDLKRQVGTSVFLTGKDGDYQVFSVQNKVAQ
jgi:alginate O-acetyltransferase complex protein AlgF